MTPDPAAEVLDRVDRFYRREPVPRNPQKPKSKPRNPKPKPRY